ncbi:MAG: glycosyltransferase family 2 protein [Brevefilum sp.]
MNEWDIGVVVNYFWLPTYPKTVQLTTWSALLSLHECELIKKVVVVDGSPEPDPFIADITNQLGYETLSYRNNLSFAEGFNTGINYLDNEYICLMANDVFPTKDFFEKCFHWIAKPDVGCVFPYLSFSDYPVQMPFFVRKPVTCEPTSMTLNVNIFKSKVLKAIGGINEMYTGAYNDVVALMEIRKLGYRVVLVGGTKVNHIGKMTISQGTNYILDGRDYLLFQKNHPNYVTKHGKWKLTRWKAPFSVNKKIALFWWVCQNVPSTRLRKLLEWFTLWLEPELTKIK